jgi:tripartite ATP-independent transporter DctP family solute receptor
MKHGVGIVLVVLAIVGLAATAAAQQATVLRLAHVGGPGSLYEIGAMKFAAMVHDSLKGRVEIKAIGGSQLGSDEQVIRGIKIGAPEMALMSTVIESVEPKYGVFEMPYLITSRAQVHRATEHPKVQAALFEGLPAKGIRVLGFWENGFRHVTNNVRPIKEPGDLKGLKLRVPSGVWRLKMFKAYGANPQPIPLKEVYAALKSGAMDGEENPFSQIAGSKFQEVQKYLSMTGHVYSPLFVLIGEDTWKKLPADVQTVLARTAWNLGDFARSEGERLDKDLLKALVPPMQLNEANKDAFIRASAAIYEEFGQQVPGGKELITVIQSLR